MKFFTVAIAALAGSAMAAPVLDVVDTATDAAPCPCAENGGVGVPPIKLPGLGCPGGDDDDESSSPVPGFPGDNTEVVAIVETVVNTVVTVEGKVKAHLDLIASIIATADIDVQALVKVLVDLEGDLKELIACVPTLDGLVLDADALVAADLEVVLDLVVRVKAILAEVQVCLKGLVVLKKEILVAIAAELKACLGLVVSVANPIVKFVLSLVGNLRVGVDLKVIVGKITTCANEITETRNGFSGLLRPVFELLKQ